MCKSFTYSMFLSISITSDILSCKTTCQPFEDINAANLNLVAFARYLPHSGGQTLALFSIAIAAAEVAVGLALIIVAYRMYKNVDVADFRSLKG